MRRVITSLLASAALASGSGALAQGWQNRHQAGQAGENANPAAQSTQGDQGAQGGAGSGSNGGWHRNRSGGGGNGPQVQTESAGGGASWRHGQGGGSNNGPVMENAAGGDHGYHRDNNWKARDNNWKDRDNNGPNNNWRWQRNRDSDRWIENRHGGNWNNNWRRDRRWNWQTLRMQDRARFHLPAYRAPHGIRYHRYFRGARLARFLFVSAFWFDAADFGLPPAYGPYRWVRYFNDALLVNIYTGEVVDVIPDFFW